MEGHWRGGQVALLGGGRLWVSTDRTYAVHLRFVHPLLGETGGFFDRVDCNSHVPQSLDNDVAPAGSIDVGGGPAPKLGCITLAACHRVDVQVDRMRADAGGAVVLLAASESSSDRRP